MRSLCNVVEILEIENLGVVAIVVTIGQRQITLEALDNGIGIHLWLLTLEGIIHNRAARNCDKR